MLQELQFISFLIKRYDKIIKMDEDLAYKISCDRLDRTNNDQMVWVRHYHCLLKDLYQKFVNLCEINKLPLTVTEREFYSFLFDNTERYYVPKLRRKVRLLV
jgi:hypothetical protein